MKIKFILLLVFSTLIFGCSTSENKENTINQEPEIETTKENHHHNENEAIVLDNGNKWKVVPDMLAFIRNMEKGVLEFSTKENPSSEEYQELAVLIDENIRSLTSNCTMEGQAHDELHKWLLPFISLSEEFDVAAELEEQRSIYNDFKKSFKSFNIYFE